MIGYKVVKWHGNRYTSAFVNSRSPYCVTYEVGVKATPPIGGLFAFAYRSDAKRFAQFREGTMVFEAELENSQPIHYISYRFTASAIKRFWRDRVEAGEAPIGSVSCTGITLLEQVT